MRATRGSVVLEGRTGTYHVTSRCTRQLSMLRDGGGEGGAVSAEPVGLRKEMLLARLEAQVEVMAVQVIAFAIMDNHVHTLLRVDHEAAAGWSDEEVLRRWWALHPLRDGYNRPREAERDERVEALADPAFLAGCRQKLVCLSHFMKCFKQHAAEWINRLEASSGPVWAGRSHCKRVKDPTQLVATMIYVDLNPFAAGACETPEDGAFTSLAGRLGRDVPAVERGDAAEADGSADRAPREELHPGGPRSLRCPPRRPCGRWLRPLDEPREPRRRGGASGEASGACAAGTVTAGLSLRVYLRLLDAVARTWRDGKHRLGPGARGVFDRLGLDAEALEACVEALRAARGRERLGAA